ncbi:MAG: DUF819 family protein [Bacteroidales bacterium]|nr:DUF819 family protein [Bacteroidales bacterium]
MGVFILILFYILAPLGLLFLCQKSKFFNKFGTVALAYILGIIAGNSGLISPNFKPMQDTMSSVTIALALPLLLFSINLKQWSRLAYKTGLAVFFGILSVLLVATAGFFIFRDKIDDCWQVTGMMVGVYMGGTPNMAAIMKALNGNPDTFILLNAYDILICMFYFIFLITYAQKFLGKILPPFKPAAEKVHLSNQIDDFDGLGAFSGLGKKQIFLPLLSGVLLSAAIVGAAMLLQPLFPADYKLAGVILSITALSIVFSLVPRINKIQKTFQSGMYLIIIFCIVVGSMADFSTFTLHSFYIAAYIAMVVLGSFTLQVIFSKIFKIDTDTTIITSTALIYSSPFVPTVANALKNKEIILSGITIGIIGYALGNFLGISLAYFLR